MSVWKHDLYSGPGKTLGSRLSSGTPIIQDSVPKYNANVAAQALRQAVGLASARSTSNLSIKGASSGGANVIQVENLASGTTAADVEVCCISKLVNFSVIMIICSATPVSSL